MGVGKSGKNGRGGGKTDGGLVGLNWSLTKVCLRSISPLLCSIVTRMMSIWTIFAMTIKTHAAPKRGIGTLLEGLLSN